MTEQLAGQSNERLSPADALVQTSRLIDQTLRQSPPVIRQYTARLADAKGKMLRAFSLLACARGDDLLVPADACLAAAAIELVHLATLVHDDVIDEADLRRGQPTLSKTFGNRIAIVCGDYLLSQGLRLLAGISDPAHYFSQRLSDHLSALCLGELNQMINNNNFNLSPLQYFRIINGKTAALFEASCLAGAVIAGLPPEVSRLFGRFGHDIGMIFQLTDDCLDFEADEQSSGKNVQTDYEQHVVTLPLVFAMAADPDFKARLIAADTRGEKLPRPQVNQSVLSGSGCGRTRLVARHYAAKAEKMLDRLDLPAEKRADLDILLQKALRLPVAAEARP